MSAFDDLLLPVDDFLIDPEDVNEITVSEAWDTGNSADIFASGEQPDIFNTK